MNHYQNKQMFWTSKTIEGLLAFIVTVIAAILGTLLGSQMRPILVNVGLMEPPLQSEESMIQTQEHPKKSTSLPTINPPLWETCELDNSE